MGETPYMACLVDWDEYLPDDYLNLKMMGWTGWILGLGGTGSKMAAEQTKRAEKLDSTYEVRYLAAQRQREKNTPESKQQSRCMGIHRRQTRKCVISKDRTGQDRHCKKSR